MNLKKHSIEQLHEYAEDLRQSIISICMANGGHLGASLGAVEIAIALHAVFDSPREALVWDVGHQAYAHKLITGRAERFHTLRQLGGISGFLSREESEHDVFGAGHSSTSLSAALGIAWAKGREKKKDWTVAVIGDGGLTAGLAFEALNNFRTKPTGPILVILNDNQMSISPNVGAVPGILSGETEYGKNARDFFSLFGLDYHGPMDGHNLEGLIGALTGIRCQIREDGTSPPVLLHVLTQKGKGYAPAEENPGGFHGISPIQEKVDVSLKAAPKGKTYSDAFGEAICRAARENPRVVAITAAMPEGTGLLGFSQRYSDRFFDVGIAEPHAVTFAAGLATQGFRPVVAVYSTFLQRGLDAIIHDVALQSLPVVLAIDRAGLVGADGPTHHGMFDLAYLGMIPGLVIFAPETLEDVGSCLEKALKHGGPVAIRYPRGSGPLTSEIQVEDGLRWHRKAPEPELIVVSVGSAGMRVSKALATLETSRGITQGITWISVISAKPISKMLTEYLTAHAGTKTLCIEDGVVHGGVGQQLGAIPNIAQNIELMGYGDHFVPQGAPSKLDELEHVSAADIEKAIRAHLGIA